MASPSSEPSPRPATRLVVHADDVGMNHGANRAFLELSRLGTVSAGSVMVPCPWFSEIAEAAAPDGTLDCGVHLTLNSEMTHYRWGPLSRPSLAAGLLDPHGYLWPDVATLRRHAHPEAVEAEWRCQIERARAAGIDITHLDAHMGSALAPEWCERYAALGIELEIPTLLTATLGAYGPSNHLAGADEAPYDRAVTAARAAGMPVFDQVLETDFSRPRGRPAGYEAMLGGLDGGLVYCAFHPNAPGGAEIEVIEPDTCHVRTDEYELFRTPYWMRWLESRPFTLTGVRELRDAWRAGRSRSRTGRE